MAATPEGLKDYQDGGNCNLGLTISGDLRVASQAGTTSQAAALGGSSSCHQGNCKTLVLATSVQRQLQVSCGCPKETWLQSGKSLQLTTSPAGPLPWETLL